LRLNGDSLEVTSDRGMQEVKQRSDEVHGYYEINRPATLIAMKYSHE
jgi:hypothetical protein